MNEDKIIIDSLKPFLPIVKEWILNYDKEHSLQGRAVSGFGFPRLSRYYSTSKILDTARVVFVEKVELIPLSQLGIPGFGDFEKLDAAGATYLNTFYVNKNYADSESIFFHELVHIAQWYYLGIDTFLLLYGLGLKNHGYEGNPLENQAYSLQERFEKSSDSFDVELQIIPALDNMIKEIY